MTYPGRVIKEGERDKEIVRAIQAELARHGLGPLGASGVFGAKTKIAVKLFQARHVDSEGNPLEQDGKVGALTWAALFGDDAVPVAVQAATPFLSAVVARAASQVGVLEQPRNSNSGPEVDEYLRRAGVPVNLPPEDKYWCCAFVYWCFDEAAKGEGRSNPMVKTPGCLKHWKKAESHGARLISAQRATNDPGLVLPGMVFIRDYGGGAGHTGLIEKVTGGLIHTIEGNTDASGSRAGGGVYRLKRKIVDIKPGFIDYSEA